MVASFDPKHYAKELAELPEIERRHRKKLNQHLFAFLARGLTYIDVFFGAFLIMEVTAHHGNLANADTIETGVIVPVVAVAALVLGRMGRLRSTRMLWLARWTTVLLAIVAIGLALTSPR